MPSGPMDIILKEFRRNIGIKGLLTLRLVSKQWRDSCTEYSGAVDITVKRSTDLIDPCKIWPSLTGLTVSWIDRHTDLNPLSNCSRLTNVRLIGRKGNFYVTEPQLLLGLAHMPKSLRAMSLVDLWVEPGSLENIRFVGLTQLRLLLPRKLTSDPHALLKHLPQLQVCNSTSSLLPSQVLSACRERRRFTENRVKMSGYSLQDLRVVYKSERYEEGGLTFCFR